MAGYHDSEKRGCPVRGSAFFRPALRCGLNLEEATMKTEKPLTHQLQDRVYSCVRMLEQQDLPEDHPDLAEVLYLSGYLNHKLSNMTGIESVTDELDDDETDDSPLYLDIGEDRDSGGSALDDLNLIHERLDTLLTAINDVVMSGEERNLLSLSTMARHQLRDANRICQANRQWSKA